MKQLRIEGTLAGRIEGAKARTVNGRTFVYLDRVYSADLPVEYIARARAIMAQHPPTLSWVYVAGGIVSFDGDQRRPDVRVFPIASEK